MRAMYASDKCLRTSMYEGFKIENPKGCNQVTLHIDLLFLKPVLTVVYEDLLLDEFAERCPSCYCCSKCQLGCQCALTDEDEDATIMRVLGLDPTSENLRRAQEWRGKFVAEEVATMENDLRAEEDNASDEEDNASDEEDAVKL